MLQILKPAEATTWYLDIARENQLGIENPLDDLWKLGVLNSKDDYRNAQ